jgi:hypothetical protein
MEETITVNGRPVVSPFVKTNKNMDRLLKLRKGLLASMGSDCFIGMQLAACDISQIRARSLGDGIDDSILSVYPLLGLPQACSSSS